MLQCRVFWMRIDVISIGQSNPQSYVPENKNTPLTAIFCCSAKQKNIQEDTLPL
jgi:hypothetical protein